MVRRLQPNQVAAESLLTPLFDRFESNRPTGLAGLARDIADILGARRTLPGRVPGVLGWGLPGMAGLAPNSEKDRQEVALLIEKVIERFEPRLTDVRVTPIPGTVDFAFNLEARLEQLEDDGVLLRIMSPRPGGALGADVTVIGGRQ